MSEQKCRVCGRPIARGGSPSGWHHTTGTINENTGGTMYGGTPATRKAATDSMRRSAEIDAREQDHDHWADERKGK